MKERVIIALLLAFLICSCSSLLRKPVRTEPSARWEALFTPIMDDMARLAGIVPLRNKPLAPDEAEIRIWRGFGVQDLEAVVLSNAEGGWTARHLVGNNYSIITDVKVDPLPPPKLGWDRFWQSLVELGVLDLRTSYDDKCFSQIDGIGNAVEISEGGTYRIYMYTHNAPDCEDSKKLDLIAELVGIQFDQPETECKQAEWLPCSKVLRKYRLEKQSPVP